MGSSEDDAKYFYGSSEDYKKYFLALGSRSVPEARAGVSNC